MAAEDFDFDAFLLAAAIPPDQEEFLNSSQAWRPADLGDELQSAAPPEEGAGKPEPEQAPLQHAVGARVQPTVEVLDGVVAADDSHVPELRGQSGAGQFQQQQQQQGPPPILDAGQDAPVLGSPARQPAAAVAVPAGSPAAATAGGGATADADVGHSPPQQCQQQTVSEAHQQVADLVRSLGESPLSANVRSAAPPVSPRVLKGGAEQQASLEAAAHQDNPAGGAATASAAARAEPPSDRHLAQPAVVPQLMDRPEQMQQVSLATAEPLSKEPEAAPSMPPATQADEDGPWEDAAAALGQPASQDDDSQDVTEELRAAAAGQVGLASVEAGTQPGWEGALLTQAEAQFEDLAFFATQLPDSQAPGLAEIGLAGAGGSGRKQEAERKLQAEQHLAAQAELGKQRQPVTQETHSLQGSAAAQESLGGDSVDSRGAGARRATSGSWLLGPLGALTQAFRRNASQAKQAPAPGTFLTQGPAQPLPHQLAASQQLPLHQQEHASGHKEGATAAAKAPDNVGAVVDGDTPLTQPPSGTQPSATAWNSKPPALDPGARATGGGPSAAPSGHLEPVGRQPPVAAEPARPPATAALAAAAAPTSPARLLGPPPFSGESAGGDLQTPAAAGAPAVAARVPRAGPPTATQLPREGFGSPPAAGRQRQQRRLSGGFLDLLAAISSPQRAAPPASPGSARGAKPSQPPAPPPLLPAELAQGAGASALAQEGAAGMAGAAEEEQQEAGAAGGQGGAVEAAEAAEPCMGGQAGATPWSSLPPTQVVAVSPVPAEAGQPGQDVVMDDAQAEEARQEPAPSAPPLAGQLAAPERGAAPPPAAAPDAAVLVPVDAQAVKETAQAVQDGAPGLEAAAVARKAEFASVAVAAATQGSPLLDTLPTLPPTLSQWPESQLREHVPPTPATSSPLLQAAQPGGLAGSPAAVPAVTAGTVRHAAHDGQPDSGERERPTELREAALAAVLAREVEARAALAIEERKLIEALAEADPSDAAAVLAAGEAAARTGAAASGNLDTAAVLAAAEAAVAVAEAEKTAAGPGARSGTKARRDSGGFAFPTVPAAGVGSLLDASEEPDVLELLRSSERQLSKQRAAAKQQRSRLGLQRLTEQEQEEEAAGEPLELPQARRAARPAAAQAAQAAATRAPAAGGPTQVEPRPPHRTSMATQTAAAAEQPAAGVRHSFPQLRLAASTAVQAEAAAQEPKAATRRHAAVQHDKPSGGRESRGDDGQQGLLPGSQAAAAVQTSGRQGTASVEEQAAAPPPVPSSVRTDSPLGQPQPPAAPLGTGWGAPAPAPAGPQAVAPSRFAPRAGVRPSRLVHERGDDGLSYVHLPPSLRPSRVGADREQAAAAAQRLAEARRQEDAQQQRSAAVAAAREHAQEAPVFAQAGDGRPNRGPGVAGRKRTPAPGTEPAPLPRCSPTILAAQRKIRAAQLSRLQQAVAEGEGMPAPPVWEAQPPHPKRPRLAASLPSPHQAPAQPAPASPAAAPTPASPSEQHHAAGGWRPSGPPVLPPAVARALAQRPAGASPGHLTPAPRSAALVELTPEEVRRLPTRPNLRASSIPNPFLARR